MTRATVAIVREQARDKKRQKERERHTSCNILRTTWRRKRHSLDTKPSQTKLSHARIKHAPPNTRRTTMSLIPRGFWNPLGQPQRAGPLSGTRSHAYFCIDTRKPKGVVFLLLLRARSVSRLNEECFLVGEKDEHTFCAFHRFVCALRSRYCVYALLFARTNADLMLSPLLLPRVLFCVLLNLSTTQDYLAADDLRRTRSIAFSVTTMNSWHLHF